MNLTTRCSIACSIVGVGVHDDPHIFNAGKRLASKLFTIHLSICRTQPMPCAAYAVRSTLCASATIWYNHSDHKKEHLSQAFPLRGR